MKKIFTGITCIGVMLSANLLAKEPVNKTAHPLSFTKPLQFIENKGQVVDQDGKRRTDIDYKLDAGNMQLFIGDGRLHYQWIANSKVIPAEPGQKSNVGLWDVRKDTAEPADIRYSRMDVTLVGADKNATVTATEEQDYVENYYLPQCPDGVTAHSYKKITYRNVYPQIDWVLYISEGATAGLKYDFIVHPGGNPANIKLSYGGADNLQLAENGTLTATSPMGTVTEHAPYSYDAVTKETVSSRFVLQDNILSYRLVSRNDVAGDLVIDPAILWAGYIGGNLGDYVYGITKDSFYNIYVCGSTTSTANLATTGAYQGSLSSTAGTAGFIARYDSETGAIQWATYYYGSNAAYGNDITQLTSICSDGYNIFIGGVTTSASGIATSGAYQTSPNGISSSSDRNGILLKFNGSGQRIWGTYFGNGGTDVHAVAADGGGNVYLAGATTGSVNIATSGAHQTIFSGGGADGFLAKFNSLGALQWSTFYGGTGSDIIWAVNCDAAGNVIIGGSTGSASGIATSGAHQTIAGTSDDFIAKFNSNGVRQWGTYYGGTATYNSQLTGVATDASNNIYICGYTPATSDYATTGAYQTSYIGNGTSSDGYIAKFNSGGVRQWGTYYNYSTLLNAIATSPNGDIYLWGRTLATTGIATSDAYQSTVSAVGSCIFVIFNTAGQRLYGTYLGGNDADLSTAVAYNDVTKKAHLSGYTFSSNAISYGTGTSYSAFADGFVATFITDTMVYIRRPYVDTVFCPGDTLRLKYSVNTAFNSGNVFTAQLSDASGSFASPVTIGSKTATTGDTIICVIPKTMAAGTGYRVRIVAGSPARISYDDGSDIRIKAAPAAINASSNTPVCEADTIRLTGSTASSGVSWQWRGPNTYSSTSQNNKIGNVTASMAGSYIMKVTLNATGCSFSDTETVATKPLPDKPVAGSNTPLCTGASLALTATSTTSGVSWQWTGPNSFSSTLQNPSKASMTVSDGGNYIVNAILNGCITKDTTNVLVYPVTPAPAASNNTPACIGSNVMLYASNVAGATYSWTGPGSYTSAQQNPVINHAGSAEAGTYSVIATANGCPSAAASTIVNLIPGPDVNIYPTPGDSVCNGKKVTLTAIVSNPGSNPQYQWLKNGNPVSGATSISYTDFTVVDGDNYQVILTPGTGAACTTPVYSISIPITVLQYQVPYVSVTASDSNAWPGLLINFNATAGNAGGDPKYQWTVNGQNVTGATADNWGATTLSNGDSVCVLMTSSYLCPTPATVKACKVVKIATGIDDAGTARFHVYPNPVNGVLYIDGLAKGTQIQLNDIYGRVVYKATAAKDKETINTANLLAGSYILQLTTTDGRKVGYKVVVD
ncbi:MAG: T9SS type A sorting domain-containing protein [Bacteroidetes bacterium]|nr:T9SS type A sorting domain-containing protein [Bacteroidota bacterium]